MCVPPVDECLGGKDGKTVGNQVEGLPAPELGQNQKTDCVVDGSADSAEGALAESNSFSSLFQVSQEELIAERADDGLNNLYTLAGQEGESKVKPSCYFS